VTAQDNELSNAIASQLEVPESQENGGIGAAVMDVMNRGDEHGKAM